MLSRHKTTNENLENGNASSLKTPASKRSLAEVNELKPASTPLGAVRKGLRDLTNSVAKEAVVSILVPAQLSTIRKPSKLSKMLSEDDMPEPEYAPVLSIEEEEKLYEQSYDSIPVDYDLTTILHPLKKKHVRPHEILSMQELGHLWIEIASKGREKERLEMEETIRSLDSFNVEEDKGFGTKVGQLECEIPFLDVPDDVELREPEQ